jgi:hypothetical protein
MLPNRLTRLRPAVKRKSGKLRQLYRENLGSLLVACTTESSPGQTVPIGEGSVF